MEELAAVLIALRREPIQDQLDALNEIVRDIFSILLQVPEMIEDQMKDLQSLVSSLSGDLEQTRGQVKEIQRAKLPSPVKPPPAPQADGNLSPNPSIAEPAKTEVPVVSKTVVNRESPGSTKPDLHGLVMRELKDLLDRRKKYVDSQN
jgi:hypothetical protein